MVPSSRAMWSLLASFWWHSTTPTTDMSGNTPSLPCLGFDAGDESAGCVARLSTIDDSQSSLCVGRMSSRCVGGIIRRAFVDDSSFVARSSTIRHSSRVRRRFALVAMRRRFIACRVAVIVRHAFVLAGKRGGRRHRASRVRRRFTVVAMRRRRDASCARRRFTLVTMRRRSIACHVV